MGKRFYLYLGVGSTYWDTGFCQKDTESTDGLGLPGHHGCGNKTIPASTIYLG